MTNISNGPLDETDERILGGLATLFQTMDPPPATLDADVIFRLSLAALDAELATLRDDSELLLRSAEPMASETITFTSSSLQLMITTTDDDAGLRIDGWVTGGGVLVELVRDGEKFPATSDVHGRLVWRGIAHGRVRFLIHPPSADGRSVVTPVVEL